MGPDFSYLLTNNGYRVRRNESDLCQQYSSQKEGIILLFLAPTIACGTNQKMVIIIVINVTVSNAQNKNKSKKLERNEIEPSHVISQHKFLFSRKNEIDINTSRYSSSF